MTWSVDAEIATSILGAIGLATIIGWLARRAFKLVARIIQFLDAWLGEPPRDGLPGRPGVMERLTVVEKLPAQIEELRDSVQAVRDELPKNGVPLAWKIDRLWTKYLTDQERADHAPAG